MSKYKSYTFSNERIFTDGAQLAPMIITKENGETVMIWVVDKFEGDSYMNGLPVNPAENSDNIKDLLHGGENDE